MPSLNRMMIFVDGENLVFRYQSMLNKGYVPLAKTAHIPDVLVWRDGAVPPSLASHLVLRATYYTYAVGGEDVLYEIRDQIKSLRFQPQGPQNLPITLTPQVFKKPRKSAQAKGVDIQLTVDVLTHVYSNTIDAVYLLSGDGDYEPLVKEVLRQGKQVYVAAFSDGLNGVYRHLADSFVLLENHFFDLEKHS